LPFDNPVLLFIRKIRDEVHRFGIEFHRNKRSTGLLQNELHNIQGIGEKTVEVLLKHFRSVKSIESADAEELEKVAGIKKAAIIRDYFKKKGAG
jgi:excinuclease ABC subunit C